MSEKKKLKWEETLLTVTEKIERLKRNPAPSQIQPHDERLAELEKTADALDEKIYQMEISR